MIKLSNVHIGFNSTLFTSENLILERGKLYTLIGKNGIGKSTFLKTLGEIISPFQGTIKWESNLPKEKRIAFVPSKFDGVENLNTYEFISLGRAPFTNFLGKLKKEDIAYVDEIIKQINIEHLSNKDTTKLSDGERQIASIAKALAQNTELILLDEPNAYLDFENKFKINRILSKIAKERNCCIIQSSHDLDFSIELADEILVINSNLKQLQRFYSKTTAKQDILKAAFPFVNLSHSE